MDTNKIIYAKDNAILYKTFDDEIGWNIRWLKSNETSCQKVCEEENYAKTYCLYLDKDFLTQDIHLRTEIISYNNKFYFPDELIPYPLTEPEHINQLNVNIEWEDEEEFFEGDYDEVYNGVEQLWTDIRTKFSANENMDELGIVAQYFTVDFPVFLEELEQNKQAVYHNEEYSPFKWLAWLKDDKIRLIHQDYRNYVARTEFDILMDKEQFFSTCNYMLQAMQEYADKDKARYENYVKEKYKR